MTEEQKKYYNAMKKLGSKKPQKPIPRPQVPALRAPPPTAHMRLLPKGALLGVGMQKAACSLPTRLCPWCEAGAPCRKVRHSCCEGRLSIKTHFMCRQQWPDKLGTGLPLAQPCTAPPVSIQLPSWWPLGARGGRGCPDSSPSEQPLREKDEGLLRALNSAGSSQREEGGP